MGVRRLRKCIALLLLCLLLWEICCGAQAGSGVQISYSPDGRAFTTNSGETSTIWYENGDHRACAGEGESAGGGGRRTYILLEPNGRHPCLSLEGGASLWEMHSQFLRAVHIFPRGKFRKAKMPAQLLLGLEELLPGLRGVCHGFYDVHECGHRRGNPQPAHRHRVLLSLPLVQKSGTGPGDRASYLQGGFRQSV